MGTLYIDSVSHIDNAVLVERFQSGEIRAFDEIVDRFQNRVYNMAYRITRNCEDAYDVSQEVFIKVFRSLSKLKNSAAFDMWLRRVTVNACMDHLRRQSKEKTMEDFSCLDRNQIENINNMFADMPVENGELRNMISRAVEQLPKKQQRVFILRHYEGLSLKEIAKTVDCSLGTVKAHLFRATRRMRKLLTPYVA